GPEIHAFDDRADVNAVLVMRIPVKRVCLGIRWPDELVPNEADARRQRLVNGPPPVGGDSLYVVVVRVIAERLDNALLDREGVGVDPVAPGAIGGGDHAGRALLSGHT